MWLEFDAGYQAGSTTGVFNRAPTLCFSRMLASAYLDFLHDGWFSQSRSPRGPGGTFIAFVDPDSEVIQHYFCFSLLVISQAQRLARIPGQWIWILLVKEFADLF